MFKRFALTLVFSSAFVSSSDKIKGDVWRAKFVKQDIKKLSFSTFQNRKKIYLQNNESIVVFVYKDGDVYYNCCSFKEVEQIMSANPDKAIILFRNPHLYSDLDKAQRFSW